MAGGFGGLLYTIRDSGFELIHKNDKENQVLRLGWLADCAYGIAGAFVVFLLMICLQEEGILYSRQTGNRQKLNTSLDRLIPSFIVGGNVGH